MKPIAEKFASDMTSGEFANFPYAVAAVKNILEEIESYKYLKQVFKHMYVLMVNEVKVYQKYDENQKIFKQTQIKSVPQDINSSIITGIIVPSGLAKSNTIKPIDRPLISQDMHKEIYLDQISQTLPLQVKNKQLIQSGARYRLICNRHNYILAASDRYAPQLFLNLKYVMDLDIEFSIDFQTAECLIYRVNKPNKSPSLQIISIPYDENLIKQYQNKIKFIIRNGLDNCKSSQAILIDDDYSQPVGKYDYIHGPYEWQNNDLVNSSEYNMLVKFKKKKNGKSYNCQTNL